MNVLITGGTGFVGRRLCEALVARGDVVTVISRDPALARRDGLPGVDYRGWLPALDAYHAVVNLAGEPIFGRRWNAQVKRAIHDSRVDGTRRLVEAITRAKDPPHVLVNASAIGFYGDRGGETLSEQAGPGSDFMASVCVDWEQEAAKCPVRTVILRLGVVLGPDGGALATMLPFFKLGLGGPIGLGGQWFSWITREDLVAMILWAIDEPQVRGPVNAVSPGTVTNRAFSFALGRVLGRPAFFPVPPLALRLKFGEVAQVLTGSQRVEPRAALAGGFSFRHGEVEAGLRAALGR